jgi:hypothetical protein
VSKIEIQISKTKILLLLLGSIGFVVLGAFFILNPAKFVSPIMRSPEIIRIGGIASVLFFGAVGFYGTRKMFDNTIGLTIDDNGIFDNTNVSSVGLIKWMDIAEIKTEQVASTKFLLIYTTNPSFYLNKVKGFQRKLMEGNNKMYGTPLSITSKTLKYNFNELEKLLTEKLNEQHAKMPNR